MRYLLISALLLLIVSCNSKSQISKNLDCSPVSYPNLELVNDVHNLFSVQLPDNWKTNLYYDNNQSSIYSADTTKQLTETFLIDITLVDKALKLNDNFIQKFKANLISQNLVESTSYDVQFQEKDSYYSRALGKKGNFNYQIANLFIKRDANTYIHAKIEIYGDSLVNQRICNALSLIEKITY